MIVIFYFIFVVLISFALGQRIFRWMEVKFANELERFVFSFPLGISALAYITFFIGIIGLLYKSIIITILILLFILFIKDIRDLILYFFNFVKNFIKKIFAKKIKFRLKR